MDRSKIVGIRNIFLIAQVSSPNIEAIVIGAQPQFCIKQIVWSLPDGIGKVEIFLPK